MDGVETTQVMTALNEAGGSDLFSTLVLVAGLIMIFYFTMIRPQAKEKKEHENMIASLTKGTKVVTASGLHGKIVEVRETTFVLEIANKTSVTVEKTAIGRVNTDDAQQTKK